jgi:hypothetical protein
MVVMDGVFAGGAKSGVTAGVFSKSFTADDTAGGMNALMVDKQLAMRRASHERAARWPWM